MTTFNVALIKKHPVLMGGAILGGGVLIILVMRGRSSPSQTATASTTGMSAGDYALAQINAKGAISEQLAGIQAGVQLAGISATKAVDLAQNQTALASVQANQVVALQQISKNAQTQQAAIQAQTKQLALVEQAAVNQTQINAVTQRNLATTNANLQTSLANINANEAMQISAGQQKTARHQSDNGLWSTVGSIAGGLALAFL